MTAGQVPSRCPKHGSTMPCSQCGVEERLAALDAGRSASRSRKGQTLVPGHTLRNEGAPPCPVAAGRTPTRLQDCARFHRDGESSPGCAHDEGRVATPLVCPKGCTSHDAVDHQGGCGHCGAQGDQWCIAGCPVDGGHDGARPGPEDWWT